MCFNYKFCMYVFCLYVFCNNFPSEFGTKFHTNLKYVRMFAGVKCVFVGHKTREKALIYLKFNKL